MAIEAFCIECKEIGMGGIMVNAGTFFNSYGGCIATIAKYFHTAMVMAAAT